VFCYFSSIPSEGYFFSLILSKFGMTHGAPGGASSTDLSEPTLGERQILHLRQGTLASCLAGAIDVEDLPLSACSIQERTSLALCGERVGEQILQNERTQGFHNRRGEADTKATERRAARHLLPVEQGHAWFSTGSQPFREGLEGAFAAPRVAEEDRQDVEDLVLPNTPSCNADVLSDGRKDPLRAQVLDAQHSFPQPTGD
jgi:hypothetical protein